MSSPISGAAPPLFEELPGGVCAVDGITAAGIAAGLKPSGRPDLALVAASHPVPAAGVQTTNQVKAAPVVVTAEHLAGGRARAVLLNSGSANACSGPGGEQLARRAAVDTAAALGCAPQEILVCSTGVIGSAPAEAPYLGGIPAVVGALSATGNADAARAIMTTDLVPKEAAVTARGAGGGSCTIGGMTKGSGMIAPALATMLTVLTTDAPVAGAELQQALRTAVDATFNRISVDGCMSTNDAVLVLATGTATEPPDLATFTAGLTQVCARLAEAIVRDGEGATRLLRVTVREAVSEDDALTIARRVGTDSLVKTALAGSDPNWGRVLAAVGAAPVPLRPEQLAVSFGGISVCRDGVAFPFDRDQAVAALSADEVDLVVRLGLGDADATFLTCDLTHGYIRINAEYTT